MSHDPSSASSAHPFFTGIKEPGPFVDSPTTLIHFLHLDPFTSLPPPSPEAEAGPSKIKIPIVFYDLDGTLIKTRKGGQFPSDRDDWAWWHPSVPARLKAEWEEGKHLVVISNQGDNREKIRREWNAKLPLIVSKVSKDILVTS